ncbi:prolipoprotein diacylglyceryl transferase [Candidatus Peregrinibacteria bacterium]|nr:prolipoprotein diacylglyceryl transferase [Candidatus Peregrinibacteria bacterium]
MIPYPNIDPEIISAAGLSIRWYGVMYVLAFLTSLLLVKKFFRERKIYVSNEFLTDLLLAVLLGVLIGGRLGHVLTSHQSFYFTNPFEILKIWKGGMGFFGGVIGVAVAIYIFSKVQKISFYKIIDLIIPCVPLGIAFVRIGNFINGELYGRVAKTFCMYFPDDPRNCRYPSQIIQFALEGAALFLILFFLRKKKLEPGVLSWLFIALYGVFRFIAEFFREPQPEQPMLYIFTFAQILSTIMIIIGAGMIIKIKWPGLYRLPQFLRKKS